MGQGKEPADKRRPIRSYVLRQGRLTPAQKDALERLWPPFGLDASGPPLDFRRLFGRSAPVILEIGFGNGQALCQMARTEPGYDYLGIEVHQPGVGHLLRLLEDHGLENVRVACTDAVAFLNRRIANGALAGVRIWFPDPWPKKRHHKRRLVQPAFVDLLASKMAAGAVLHLATDWAPYAEHMLGVLRASPEFHNLSPTDAYCGRPEWRPMTRFERRGEALGHEAFDLLFRRDGGGKAREESR